MKLYIMKRDALETLKSNLPAVFGKYYTEKSNGWISELYGDDPFIEFKEVKEIKLANLDSGLTPGEIDLENCKIMYERLRFLSESQASDERLWAGLTHTVFYDYMRKRWGYGAGKRPKSPEKEAGIIRSRFFYRVAGRGGFYRNTLSKCWWVGHNTYDASNENNHFESLDIIGSNDLNSKITEFFHNFTFSSNPVVLLAIIDALRQFRQERKQILVRDHIRPALTYLNAVGGAVVIDCLPKEEITDIFYDAIIAIMQGDKPALDFGKAEDTDDEDVDSSDDESGVNNVAEIEVILGCKIFVRSESGETKVFKYDYVNGVLPRNLEVFTGRKIGDVVVLNNMEWKIEDIVM